MLLVRVQSHPWAAGVTVALIVFAVATWLLAGCRAPAPLQVHATVVWPTVPSATCDVLPMPSRPHQRDVDADTASPRGVFVSMRDWQDRNDYDQALYDWSMSIQQCLAKLAPAVRP